MENKEHDLWQTLVESKEFEQLTTEEREFVERASSEANYRAERDVLVASKMLYDEVEPQPLLIPSEKKAIVVPLYQVLLAVAASFVLGFFLFRSNQTTIELKQGETLAVTDTVYVEKLKIDTVIQTETKYVRVPSPQESLPSVNTVVQKNTVFGNQLEVQADLSTATLANKGTSASNDETLVFMESWVAPN